MKINTIAIVDGEKATTLPNKEEYSVESVVCDKENIGIWDEENWKVKVENPTDKEINCTVVFKQILANVVKVGDYVSYTPSTTSYVIAGSLTGCPGSGTIKCSVTNQTINPSELNLWRVIKINSDKTIEIVSEYVSSTYVTFFGREGYRKLVGSLNVIASAYETEGITLKSRHIGYSNQIGICTSYNASNCTDTGYITDYNLVKSAIGSTVAYLPNKSVAQYWLASRYINVHYYIRYIDSNGNVNELYGLAGNPSISPIEYTGTYAIRPIITLKAETLFETGNGTEENPWKIN